MLTIQRWQPFAPADALYLKQAQVSDLTVRSTVLLAESREVNIKEPKKINQLNNVMFYILIKVEDKSSANKMFILSVKLNNKSVFFSSS